MWSVQPKMILRELAQKIYNFFMLIWNWIAFEQSWVVKNIEIAKSTSLSLMLCYIYTYIDTYMCVYKFKLLITISIRFKSESSMRKINERYKSMINQTRNSW